MGDEGSGLYVKEAVAEALAAELVPRRRHRRAERLGAGAADRPTGRRRARAPSPRRASLGRAGAGLLDPVGRRDRRGLRRRRRGLARRPTPRPPHAPKGTGDLLTALFAAALLGGIRRPDALGLAVGGVAEAVDAAGGLRRAADDRASRPPRRLAARQPGSGSMAEAPISGLCPPRFDAVRAGVRGQLRRGPGARRPVRAAPSRARSSST